MGIAGALVATVFTFLPSFLFILLGAPFIERSRGLQAFAAPLTAITAAVVGAILHLACTLGWQVLMPGGAVDAFALALSALVFVALLRGWLGIVPLLALSAAAGWVKTLLL